MNNNAYLNLDMILEVAELLRKNENAKEPITLANAYDISNAFC